MSTNQQRGISLLTTLGIVGTVGWYLWSSSPPMFNSNTLKQEDNHSIVASADRGIESLLGNTNTFKELPAVIQTVSGPIDTSKIEFSGDFDIQTARYHVVKKEDPLLIKGVGQVLACLQRLVYWNHNMGSGLDAQQSKNVVAMLESDPTINDVTVRINHTWITRDSGRLVHDPAVQARNPGILRVTLGFLQNLSTGIVGKLVRADMYNPWTQTANVYSNTQALPAAQIGHAKDFHRFGSDWGYAIVGMVPGVDVYQDVRAALYGKDELPPGENYQFYRLLLPALVMSGIYATGQWHRFYHRLNGDEESKTRTVRSEPDF